MTLAEAQVSVHRLLQKVVRDQLTDPAHSDAAGHARRRPGCERTHRDLELSRFRRAHARSPASGDPHSRNLRYTPRLRRPHRPQRPREPSFSYWSAGRTADAIAIEEQVTADYERILGPDHPDTLTARGNLAASYRSAERTADAITIQERVAADRERILGADHPDTVLARDRLAEWGAERGGE